MRPYLTPCHSRVGGNFAGAGFRLTCSGIRRLSCFFVLYFKKNFAENVKIRFSFHESMWRGSIHTTI
jgi:hypothetical protein